MFTSDSEWYVGSHFWENGTWGVGGGGGVTE